MNCAECKVNREVIPYIAHEAAMARAERTQCRLWITVILLIVLLVGSNMAWIWYEAQFEDVTIEQEVEQEAESGSNHFVGGDYIGETESAH